MSIEFENAFDIEEFGVVLTDDFGETIAYLTGGTGEPTGSPAPLNTYYMDITSKNMWKKIGPGDEDWILSTGTFEQLTLVGNYKVPSGTISTLNSPCFEAILDVEGILEIL